MNAKQARENLNNNTSSLTDVYKMIDVMSKDVTSCYITEEEAIENEEQLRKDGFKFDDPIIKGCSTILINWEE